MLKHDYIRDGAAIYQRSFAIIRTEADLSRFAADEAEIARDVPLVGEGLALHVSGCAKGCAHPSPAPLTIVGTERGCGVIANDTARVTPSTYLDESQLIAMLRGEPSQKREAVHA